MSQSKSLDWGGIKHAYLNGDMIVEDICSFYSVTKDALYRRIKKQNWQLRQSRRSDIGKKAEAPKPDARPDSANLYLRFFRVVDRQMARLEAKLNDNDEAANAIERERDVRTLASLVRLLEKLNELEPEKQKWGQDTDTIDANDEGAAVRLREELAGRIHSLLQEEQD